MGLLRKAAVGSLVVGLGALAVSKNKKSIRGLQKTISKSIQGALKENTARKPRKQTKKKTAHRTK